MNPEPPTTRQPTDPAMMKCWWDFSKTPTETTANALAKVLDALAPAEAGRSFAHIAGELAQRSALDRCTLTTMLTYWLIRPAGFLRATAAVKLSHPVTQPPKPVKAAEHLDPAKAKGPQVPIDLEPETGDTESPEDHARFLEALDLAGLKGQTVDLIALARRADDADDATSLKHLRDTLALLESIGKGGGYSAARRKDALTTVQGTAQEHLVEQLGFRAAPSSRVSNEGLLGKLLAKNTMAADYWRTDFRGRLRDFLKALPKDVTPGPGEALVNSPAVLSRLGFVLPPSALTGLTVKPLRGKTGLSKLCGIELGAKTGDGEIISWDGILNELGATPTPYQLYELMDAEKPPAAYDLKFDTHTAFAHLITSGRFSRLQEIAAGTGGTATLYAAIAALVLGLADGEGPARHDPLTNSAFDSLAKLLGVAVESADSPAVAMRALDLAIDEIGIIVTVAKNYGWSAYRDAMRTILLERAPGIRDRAGELEIDSHLVTGGMDALGTALWVALSRRGPQQVTRSTADVDYFETTLLLNKIKTGAVVTPRPGVLIAALNPSTPFDPPDPAKLVSDVLDAVKARQKDDPPVALVLDTTIQIAPPKNGRSQLDTVLGGLGDALFAGRVEIFLCKSFQKYASFGFGKVAAGDVTMLSKKDDPASFSSLAELLRQGFALDLTGNDEAQLVVHMLKHGHAAELTLTRSAAANAEFVDRFCWPVYRDKTLGSSYVDGIPLLLRATPTGDVTSLFKFFTPIDWRNSFSFLRTSFVGGITLPTGSGDRDVAYARVNTGHESPAGMVELLYAFGHLATGTPPGADKPAGKRADLTNLGLGDVRAHLEALKLVPTGGKSDTTRYRTSILASYCLFANQVMKSTTEEKVQLLAGFFAGDTDGVTIDTQRLLAEALFKLVKLAPVPAEPLLLGALCRAAVVLPLWQFGALAKSLKLTGIGTSEEAKRFTQIVARAAK